VAALLSRIPEDLRPLVAQARAAGWRERPARKGIVLYPPGGEAPIAVHGTPHTCGRAPRNARAQFRAAGLKLD
jgi:hypothetical protein